MFQTNLADVRRRTFQFFAGYVVLLGLVFLSFLYVGLDSNRIRTDLIDPFFSAVKTFAGIFTYEDEPPTRQPSNVRIEYNQGTRSRVIINGEEQPTNNSNSGGTVNIIYPTSQPYPTSDFDYEAWEQEVEQSKLDAQQRSDEFMEEWEKKRDEIREKNQTVQDNFDQYCVDNPDSSLCD